MAREKRKDDPITEQDDPITEQDDHCTSCTKGYNVHHCFKCGAGLCGGCAFIAFDIALCEPCRLGRRVTNSNHPNVTF